VKLKLFTTSCRESSLLRENVFFLLSNPAARSGVSSLFSL
jgi:hypothetical protein